MLTYNYNISEDDYLTFNYNFMLKSKMGKKSIRLYRIITLVMVVMCFIINLRNIQSVLHALILIGMLAVVLVILQLLVVPIYRTTVKASVKKMKKEGKLPYSKSGTVVLNEKGIEDNAGEHKLFFAWENVETVWNVPHGIYVFVNSRTAIMIIGENTDTPEKKKELLDFISQYVPESAVKTFKK